MTQVGRSGTRPVRRRWGPVLAVVVTVGALLVAGRLQNLPEQGPSRPPAPPPTTAAPVSVTSPPAAAVIPEVLRRPLRLPGLRRDGSCPTSPAAGPPRTDAHPVAAVTVGAGPVVPVLFRSAVDGRLDRSVVVYWDASRSLAGVAIVRGQRLGAPRDRIRFQQSGQGPRLVHVLDPASAYRAGAEGHWWRPTRLRAGPGCYGLQIDGPGFSEVLVVQFA
jgi:hypothetical protein